MKKTLFIITLFLFTACETNPSPQVNQQKSTQLKELKKALNNYTNATINNNITDLMSFIYSKVFTVIPKEKMKEVLENAYKQGTVPQISDVKHINIAPIEKYQNDEEYFSIITSSMTTTIPSPKKDNPRFEKYLLEMLKKDIGEKGTVKFNASNHTYIIKNRTKTIAIHEKDGWKFAGWRQAERYAQKGILPQEIIDKMGQIQNNSITKN